MQDLKYRAVILNTSEFLECDTFAPIWRVLGYHIEESPRIEFYENGVHFSTISTAPNGRIYYRRTNSLRQFDVTHIFGR